MKDLSKSPSSLDSKTDTVGEEKKIIKTVRPLTELCSLYKFTYNIAVQDGLASRLNLKFVDGVFYCKVKAFRAYLEEQWRAGAYNETHICPKCGKVYPLCYFAIGGRENELYKHCRYCRAQADKERARKHPLGELFDDEENVHSSCRIYKSIDDFIGKRLTIETKSEDDIIDFFSMTTETVLMDEDGRSAMVAGKDKDGKTRIQKLLIAEIQSLCYEGLSIYWSEKSERLYKKVIISNN